MRITFFVPAVPVAQPRQRHRVVQSGGRSFATNYTPRNSPVQDFKATVRQAASAVYQGQPLQGPVIMRLVFVMPRPRGLIFKKKPMPRAPHCGKPDCDNLFKSTVDALAGTVLRDDKQVYRVEMEKWVAAGNEQPHVEVTIISLEES